MVRRALPPCRPFWTSDAGLVPLLLTFACMWLLRKKVNPLWIIVGFFVIGIAGYAVGLLGL